MSAFNTSVSLLSTRMLNTNFKLMFSAMERLSTGFRINRGFDDPAGLISSEGLRATLATLDAEVSSLERADSVANTADSGLEVASSLLQEAQALVTANASDDTLSDEERAANQLALDSILATLDRTAGATSFNGDKLLDGTGEIQAVDSVLTLGSVHAQDLGETEDGAETYHLSDLTSGGDLNIVGGDMELAQQVIDQAMDEVNAQRGRVGAFQSNTIAAGINSREVAIENVATAESLIRNTDFASEIVNFRLAQLGVETAIAVLSIGAQTQASVLKLLWR